MPTPQSPYCGSAADTAKPILREAPILRTGSAADTAKSILREAPILRSGLAANTELKAPILNTSRLSEIARLCSELNLALRRPGQKTLTLINRALSYLTPFESPKASVVSATERHDLLTLLSTHRMILCPYIDIERIERNLRNKYSY